mmetsp:Transcript_12361/g.27736  ORF Transcript_12361/g.27736 Transcript_12361/m.27736 type:complete len:244 (+) Transcript_12361:1838-2569(+)
MVLYEHVRVIIVRTPYVIMLLTALHITIHTYTYPAEAVKRNALYDNVETALLARTINDNDSKFYTACGTSFSAHDYPEELALLGSGGEMEVIFDSGTTSHILPSKEPMSNYRERQGSVQLGDKGKGLDIVDVGDTTLMSGVLHVPKMSYGLISISKFDKTGCISICYNSRCWVVGATGDLIYSGTLKGNLYHLDAKYLHMLLDSDTDTTKDSNDKQAVQLAALAKRLVSTQLGYNDIELLHQR